MKPSTVTGLHWIEYNPFGVRQSLALRDGATAVPSYNPWDWQAQIKVAKNGGTWVAIVCCGPAAPYPLPLKSAADRLMRSARWTG